jgi:hypothetical protein
LCAFSHINAYSFCTYYTVGKAIAALKERGGSSRQAILKYIMANFNVGKDAKSVNVHLKLSLRAGVKNKSLKQSKGTGASGSLLLVSEAWMQPSSSEMYLPFFDSKTISTMYTVRRTI